MGSSLKAVTSPRTLISIDRHVGMRQCHGPRDGPHIAVRRVDVAYRRYRGRPAHRLCALTADARRHPHTPADITAETPVALGLGERCDMRYAVDTLAHVAAKGRAGPEPSG